MQIKKYVDYRLFGLLGSALMMISEFLVWFSNLTLWQIFQIKSTFLMDDAFLYIFPLVSGIICGVASLLSLYREDYKINATIIYLVGLGFMLLFLYDFTVEEVSFLTQAGIGFYFCIAGFMFVLIDMFNVLLSKD
ncbi:MAG: hypothetical protein EU533_07615 [Promethearchaeota archaeon]|nr:MAG: hypothetical protein EU533_07615 [Candidatus Lokiarchaeota archaeon]